MSADVCFSMGCIEWIGSDSCGECGRWTGAKTRYEEKRKQLVEYWVDHAWEKNNREATK